MRLPFAALVLLVSTRLLAAPAAPASPPSVRTISFVEATCNTLPAIPVSFTIPADYVMRPGANHKTSSGCLWGTAADLDRAMKDPKGIDFTGIQRGVFWAHPAGNVGFNRAKNQFFDGRGNDEAAMKRQFEKTGAKNIFVKRDSIGEYPSLQFNGDLASGPNHRAGRLSMLYIGLLNGTNTLLINYHAPLRQTPVDDQVWSQLIAGTRSTAAKK
jgi:hypothetical protein